MNKKMILSMVCSLLSLGAIGTLIYFFGADTFKYLLVILAGVALFWLVTLFFYEVIFSGR